MSVSSEVLVHSRPTIQLLMPMGGLGTRFADVGIPTPKPLIPLDKDGGECMVLKAVSSFEDLFPTRTRAAAEVDGRTGGLPDVAMRVIFVVRNEHERQFGLRTKLLEVFKGKYDNGQRGRFSAFVQYERGPADAQVKRLSGTTSGEEGGDAPTTAADVQIIFVMMHADTRGAAETCLLASAVILPVAPLVILDCDLYVRSSLYNRVLTALAHRPFLNKKPSPPADGDLPSSLLEKVTGMLVFFNSTAPRYSYAELEPLDELGEIIRATSTAAPNKIPNLSASISPSSGGRVVRTAEKVPISNCALIGAYAFASGEGFTQGAHALLQQPISPLTGLKEYYISLVFNHLLLHTSKQGVVLAVPRDEYHSFGTPEELATYNAGKESYVVL